MKITDTSPESQEIFRHKKIKSVAKPEGKDRGSQSMNTKDSVNTSMLSKVISSYSRKLHLQASRPQKIREFKHLTHAGVEINDSAIDTILKKMCNP